MIRNFLRCSALAFALVTSLALAAPQKAEASRVFQTIKCVGHVEERCIGECGPHGCSETCTPDGNSC